MTGARVKRFVTIVLAVFPCVTALPAAAQQNEAAIFISASRIPLSTTITDEERGITAIVDLAETPGLGISYTRYWTGTIATEVALQQAGGDVRARVSAGGLAATLGVGEIDILALSVLAQWHPRREAAVSPWVGGGLVILDGEIHVPRPVADLADLDDADLGQAASWLLNAGVSFRVTDRIRVAADLRYTRYKPDSPSAVIPEGEAIHPLLAGVGLRFRF